MENKLRLTAKQVLSTQKEHSHFTSLF